MGTFKLTSMGRSKWCGKVCSTLLDGTVQISVYRKISNILQITVQGQKLLPDRFLVKEEKEQVVENQQLARIKNVLLPIIFL